uniref:G_PROTEIN_RECEP_F1_2 domain-containing protein n=1 Tax=Rhabditophanes sp. KR3021 TaxID=114890 RepID=A0AC35TTX3_9BILA
MTDLTKIADSDSFMNVFIPIFAIISSLLYVPVYIITIIVVVRYRKPWHINFKYCLIVCITSMLIRAVANLCLSINIALISLKKEVVNEGINDVFETIRGGNNNLIRIAVFGIIMERFAAFKARTNYENKSHLCLLLFMTVIASFLSFFVRYLMEQKVINPVLYSVIIIITDIPNPFMYYFLLKANTKVKKLLLINRRALSEKYLVTQNIELLKSIAGLMIITLIIQPISNVGLLVARNMNYDEAEGIITTLVCGVRDLCGFLSLLDFLYRQKVCENMGTNRRNNDIQSIALPNLPDLKELRQKQSDVYFKELIANW